MFFSSKSPNFLILSVRGWMIEANINDLQVIKPGIYFPKTEPLQSSGSSLLSFFLKGWKDERKSLLKLKFLICRLGCFQKLLSLGLLNSCSWGNFLHPAGVKRSSVVYWVPETEGTGPAVWGHKPWNIQSFWHRIQPAIWFLRPQYIF